MPMWRCPHCATPQAETARCWVCHRSSTACATCRHFRRSVAAQLGYCGLDRQRRPIRGDEIRACWESSSDPAEVAAGSGVRPSHGPADLDADRTPVRRLEFVEVRSAAKGSRLRDARDATAATRGAVIVAETGATDDTERSLSISPVEPGWSLWGDVET